MLLLADPPVGKMDLVPCPNIRSAGEDDIPAVGVFLNSSKARYGSSARLISRFIILTAASAFPLDC